jgi:hypothetical protein
MAGEATIITAAMRSNARREADYIGKSLMFKVDTEGSL